MKRCHQCDCPFATENDLIRIEHTGIGWGSGICYSRQGLYHGANAVNWRSRAKRAERTLRVIRKLVGARIKLIVKPLEVEPRESADTDRCAICLREFAREDRLDINVCYTDLRPQDGEAVTECVREAVLREIPTPTGDRKVDNGVGGAIHTWFHRQWTSDGINGQDYSVRRIRWKELNDRRLDELPPGHVLEVWMTAAFLPFTPWPHRTPGSSEAPRE
jgi:hypothetical protein